MIVGSGCGSVGWAIASNKRGLWFESSHREILRTNTVNCTYWKDENEAKRGRNDLVKKYDCWYFLRYNLCSEHQLSE